MDEYHKSMVMLVRAALDEDIGPGDVTSHACLEPNPIKATIVAKSDGLLSGLEAARLTFHLVDSANQIEFKLSDGDRFRAGETIADINGFNQTVLVSERVALNFLGHLSGIATMTSHFVEQVKGHNVTILDTRKTTPGMRLLEKRAVEHGGGQNHRHGLYDMVLIKDNHIASAGSIKVAVERTREFMSSVDFSVQFGSSADEMAVEVEVGNESELREALESGVVRLLLDNQSPDELSRLVKLAREINPEAKLEASGNVTLDNVAEVAATGVDFISIGALTHSAPVSDFSLRVTQAS